MRTIAAFLVLLIFGQINAATRLIDRGGYQEYVFRGETIPTSSYLEKTLSYVGDFSHFDFSVAAVSAGSVTTSNVAWLLDDGTELATATLTSGTPITSAKSSFLRFRIYSNQGAPVTITGNIIAR